MYYSEKLRSPITAFQVKRIYGIDPSNALLARRLGIFPLAAGTAGFTAAGFKKVGNAYVTIDREFSDEQVDALRRIKAISGDATSIVANHITDWSSSVTYATNDIVEHSGSIYKARRASTNVEPGVYQAPSSDLSLEDPDWQFLH